MLYPFLSDGNFDIGFSEIKKVDGINQIRIFAEEPWKGHFKWKTLEFYIPSGKITKLEGYTREEAAKIISSVRMSEKDLFEMSKDFEQNGLDCMSNAGNPYRLRMLRLCLLIVCGTYSSCR